MSNVASSLVNPLLSKTVFLPSRSFASPSANRKRLPSSRRPATHIAVHCKKAQEPEPGAVDRRDLLLGLGGLYSATLALNREVLADPVTTVDNCRNEDIQLVVGDRPGTRSTECCPPSTNIEPVDYKIPTFTTLRERCPAQDLTTKQIRDYETAIAKSKKLNPSDPFSFIQQAKVHCAYCNYGYDQGGFPDVQLQVHFCWLFLPFHRWYVYFYERILGKLCGNENFALPFWNWDNPPGMTMPQIFINPESPLYNVNRNQAHLPPVLIDLDDADNENFTPEEQIRHNLWVTYRQMIAQGKTASCFHGGRYVGGTQTSPGPGSCETLHDQPHSWTGNPGNPNGEDMGAFYSSGYDPLFFCHHSNVDRMWSIWKQKIGREDLTDPDWLNSSFRFYDENGQLVRVYVKDCLSTEKLGYKYKEDVPLPWLNVRPNKRARSKRRPKLDPASEAKFPVILKRPIKTTVKVPKKTKPDDEDVLVIKLNLDRTVYAKFDVYVNAEDTESNEVAPADKAGSFVNIPLTADPKNNNLQTYLKLGITDLLEDIDCVKDEELEITIVPKKGKNRVEIESVKLQTTCDVV